jgi:hypothetical protein
VDLGALAADAARDAGAAACAGAFRLALSLYPYPFHYLTLWLPPCRAIPSVSADIGADMSAVPL